MRRSRLQLVPTILIVLVSLTAAVAVTWLVPSLSAASLNMLFRFRGSQSPPEDVVIVAIDDASLQRVGNWPWPRSVMANALDRITQANPRAIGLDVIYAEASNADEDKLLTEAIARSGRVVLPAQLTEAEATQPGAASTWLLPLKEVRGAAAATGHAHADPDVDGVLRTVQLSKSNERGERLWAFGLETLRVAENVPSDSVQELKSSLRLGRYEIAIYDEAEKSSLPGVTIIRPNAMLINYLGPPGTFHYYSIGEVLDGQVPASAFANKIVLIGAVAQTMGDTRITPFISYADSNRQGGTGMPGVEVHANVIETIRRGASLNPRPDWMGVAVTLLVILAATFIIRLLDGWKAIALLLTLLALIVAGSLYAFDRHFVIPPVVSMMTGFFTVVPLLLLESSINASRDLDKKLDRLARIQKRFMSRRTAEDSFEPSLSFIGSILRAESVSLFQKRAPGQPLELKARFGRAPVKSFAATNVNENHSEGLRVTLEDDSGLLVIERGAGEPFSESERGLAQEFALSVSRELTSSRQSSELQGRALPRNIRWKLSAVDEITAHLVSRVGFMNQVFTSMTDGLLVADITGRVIFANPAAHRFWNNVEAAELTGWTLTELFTERGIINLDSLRETMRAVMNGQSVTRDAESSSRKGRFYTLQFSAVVAETSKVIGLIVIITDVTKRRELDRVKAETLQLVSHELRAPLTSIRGLSETLLKYPVPEDARPEIIETIYSEAMRLSELINRYLDVTRIESGAQGLTRRVLPLNPLISDCVRVAASAAALKRIQIKLNLEEPSPELSCDPQLLAQAVNNLLINAIKYSPEASEVEVSTATDDEGRVRIEVRDHGYGIPKGFQTRVFEKFFRLERDVKSETVGTGLGLALVKEIVERHNGQVTLESETGKGSTFTIRLPLQRS